MAGAITGRAEKGISGDILILYTDTPEYRVDYSLLQRYQRYGLQVLPLGLRADPHAAHAGLAPCAGPRAHAMPALGLYHVQHPP